MNPLHIAIALLPLLMPLEADAQVSAKESGISVYSFNFVDGAYPLGLTQGPEGRLFGVTYGGGLAGPFCAAAFNCGVLYHFSPITGFRMLHAFRSEDGVNPVAPLVVRPEGGFYGSLTFGGSGLEGAVFQFNDAGLTTIHSVGTKDKAAQPNSVIVGDDGNLYGTTQSGSGPAEFGTVFRLTPDGVFSGIRDYSGSDPRVGIIPVGLTKGPDGNFYGVVSQGGTLTSFGSLFRLWPSGRYETLHTFTGEDGGLPESPLTLASDGNFYGVASAGGDSHFCHDGFLPGCGTVFRLSAAGDFRILHRFTGGLEGAGPQGPLLQGSDGGLYGSTYDGGANETCPGSPIRHLGCGVLFRVGLDGAYAVQYVFSGRDGSNPSGPMVQTQDGALWGTTDRGGTYDVGVIFRLPIQVHP